ncbi:MAG: peptide chain release factor 1 [Candidatus Coatesbacteria bacterium RBG_13_66_14]|uniref:Peptide chain release factor 1 n=1 Tax=Candidatus Coatesbacteria bacterium RBG_13_66_14 TaxID=1817816 RepID=A0A1F5EVS2_9BACT|nr:MAG: peptide chain release factor 1 [Candidatus Coatesbacteria bacterium RBG_13_66_14]
MLEKLDRLMARYDELSRELSDPHVYSDRRRAAQLGREQSQLQPIADLYPRYSDLARQIADDEAVISAGEDPELVELAGMELDGLRGELAELEERIKILLLPKDEAEERKAIVEVRAGTGGDEASLFAGDLYRMYSRYAERHNWKIEVMDSNPTEVGGFREITFAVEGKGAYGRLKFEGGVHRVQRVPVTESQGRIHTSAVSVAVLPEAEVVEVNIKPEDLRVDVFRSSGPGGQSVNTTDSAVRLTHIPTGLVVSCQDEKSQHKNKAKALRVLAARLYDLQRRQADEERDAERRLMVGTGDRSERIRTYNFPQNRLTDHRVGLTLYSLDRVMEGELEGVLEALILNDREERLAKSGA